MTEPVCALDLARLRRDRVMKLDDAMEAAGVDTLVLCAQQNVSYATGTRVPAADHVRASWWRAVAVLERGAPWPHLYTDFPEGAPAELPDEFLHRAIEVETAAGAGELAGRIGGSRVAIDDAPFPLWDALRPREVVDASAVLAPAKLTKTADELECIRQAQAVNEEAIRTVRPAAVPGVRATDLSGMFLPRDRRARRDRQHRRPRVPGDAALGCRRSVQRHRRAGLPDPDPRRRAGIGGDVMWIDTGINLHGYASDFGATWIVGREPDDVERDQFARWRAIVDRARAREAGRDGGGSRRRGRPRPRRAPAGCRTSTWPTASAPTAPRCRSSGPISATRSTRR